MLKSIFSVFYIVVILPIVFLEMMVFFAVFPFLIFRRKVLYALADRYGDINSWIYNKIVE